MKSILMAIVSIFLFTTAAASADCLPEKRHEIMKMQMAKLASEFKFRSYTIPRSEWLGSDQNATRVPFPVTFIDENLQLNTGFLYIDTVNCIQDGLVYDGAIQM